MTKTKGMKSAGVCLLCLHIPHYLHALVLQNASLFSHFVARFGKSCVLCWEKNCPLSDSRLCVLWCCRFVLLFALRKAWKKSKSPACISRTPSNLSVWSAIAGYSDPSILPDPLWSQPSEIDFEGMSQLKSFFFTIQGPLCVCCCSCGLCRMQKPKLTHWLGRRKACAFGSY